jgi:hypothetical protein
LVVKTVSTALFKVIMLVAGVAAFALLVNGGRSGNLWMALVPLILSPVCLFIIRLTLEDGRPAGLLSLKTQSWAFLIGDSLALPLMALGGLLAWKFKRDEFAPFFLSYWWIALCVVIGIAAAYGWHYLLDGPGYIKGGHGDLLGSPSKLWHDFPVYGALVGGLVYLAIPAIFQGFTSYGWLCLLGLVLWVLLGLADNTIHKLNPANLHPPVSQTLLR